MGEKYIIRRINQGDFSYLANVNDNFWLPAYNSDRVLQFSSKEEAAKAGECLVKVDKCTLEIVEIII